MTFAWNAITDSTSDDEEDDIIPTCTRVRRIAVVDGCNVMHMAAGMGFYADRAMDDEERRKPDALGLLLLLKMLLDEDFDVRIFTSLSYMSSKTTANHFILEQFKKLRYLKVVSANTHDDFAILTYATEVGGFVISNDKFREFKYVANCRGALPRVVKFTFKKIKLEKIGGREALCNGQNKYQLGMKLEMNIDQDICMSDICEDKDFLLVHSQRRLRSKVQHFQAQQIICVIADFLQREFCFIHHLKPPHLTYFGRMTPPPAQFSTFLDFFNRSLKSRGNIFDS